MFDSAADFELCLSREIKRGLLLCAFLFSCFFFFQAEDGIRDHCVTGVQTCALPILTISQGAFQTRTEFGISAKSLAFEMSSIQTNSVLKLHGFTIESRFLRKV